MLKIESNKNGLQDSINKLYDAFSGYEKPKNIVTSSVKDFDSAWHVMKSKQLRNLSERDVFKYSCSALTTIGDDRDFRYFLPRLLELMIFSDIGYGNEIFARKLVYANWRVWPDKEQVSIENFLITWWKHVLSVEIFQQNLSGSLVENTLCTIGNILENLDIFLNYWDRQKSLEAFFYIARLINGNFDTIIRLNKLQGNWPDKQSIQVRDWLAKPRLKQNLEESFYKTDDERLTREISEAVQKLEWWLGS